MPQEVVLTTIRPDHAAADRRERPKVIRLDQREFIELKALLCQVSYTGFDLGMAYHPGQSCKMLGGAFRRILDLIDRNSGRPWDAFRPEHMKAKLRSIINLLSLNLGLSLNKQMKVDRPFDEPVKETSPPQLTLDKESFIFRYRKDEPIY